MYAMASAIGEGSKFLNTFSSKKGKVLFIQADESRSNCAHKIKIIGISDNVDFLFKDAGFDTWTQLFAVAALPHLSGNRPGMAAWVPDGTTVSDKVFTIKRNPYFVGVDPKGNQLPYIDAISFTFYADKEALNLAAVAGEMMDLAWKRGV